MFCLVSKYRKSLFLLAVSVLSAPVLCADGLTLETGVYDDTHQLILVSESKPASKVFKTFNTFYYDGPYDYESSAVSSSPVAQIGNGLYVDFCIRYGSGSGVAGIWLPAGNARDLSINGGKEATSRKERIYGYYISEGGQVWQIPYWKVDAVYDQSEMAYLTPDGASEVAVQKKVLVGGIVYTCTVGRSTRIRNPLPLESSVLEKARISSDGQVLSFSDPVYTKTSVAPEDIDALILQKNTTVYPPRFLWIEPREPSIYTVLESQPPHLD